MTHMRREPHHPDEEDTTYVYSRAEDRSVWTRWSTTLEKYKPIVWLIGMFLIAAGFGFHTPKQAFDEIHQEIDTLKVHERVGAIERTTLDNKLDALIKLRCIEIFENHHEQQAVLAGLNCAFMRIP